VPSRFEPCGLTQMYGLRYGTVPVVRRVGGLADTVREAGAAGGEGSGNGFVFDAAHPQALLDAIARALETYRNPPAWRQLMLCGMAENLSWDGPAGHYMALYQQVLGERRQARPKDLD
jgi:starch synthase